MLAPKRVKHRKVQKGRRKGQVSRGNDVSFGDYGLIATSAGWVTARQIEAARIAITRKIRKYGRMWIRMFPDKPLTKKPAEVRMGKGKGSPEFWICRIKPGRVMFELDGVPSDVAREACRLAAAKLPLPTKFVARIGEGH